MKSSPKKWLKTIVNALRNGAGTVLMYISGLNISIEINNFSQAILKIIKLFPTYFPRVSGIHFRGGWGDEILIFENVEICTVLLEKQSNAICKDLLLSVPTGDKKKS